MLRGAATKTLRLTPPRRTLKLLVGAHNVPHPDKPPGEDAFYASSTHAALGVADGVGGSKRAGVDPGAFSRRLLAHAVTERTGALEAVVRARTAVKKDELCKKGGSSTLLVATLDGAALTVSNLGDSALIILRPTPRTRGDAVSLWPRILLKTQDQTHYFNCPYQASAADDDATDGDLGACGADTLTAAVRAGDVVIAATDGYWDNVFDSATLATVAPRLPARWASAAHQNAFGVELSRRVQRMTDAAEARDPARDALDALAEALAGVAVAIGVDATAVTPFSASARDDGLAFEGGKEDDVAIVCGLVVDDAVELSAVDEAPRHNFASVLTDAEARSLV